MIWKKTAAALILAAIAISVFFICSPHYVIKINKEKISESEFICYLYEQKRAFETTGGADIWETDFDGISAVEKAKQNAVNSLILVKTSISQAKRLGAFLNDDDIKKAEETAKRLTEEINKTAFSYNGKDIDVTEKQVYEITKESILQQKIYGKITESFEVSESDFDEYLNRYIEENKSTLTDFKIKYAFIEGTDNYELAEKIYFRLTGGERFEMISEDNVQICSTPVSVSESELIPTDEVYSLEKGELSTPLLSDNGFYIVYVDDIVSLDKDYLKDKLKAEYIADKKNEMYENQSRVWSENVSIEKNEKIYDAIAW